MTQALLLSALLVLSAPTSRTSSKRLQAAQAEFNQGDFDAALRLLDQAVSETSDDPTLSKIHLLRGQTYGALRDLVAAEEALAKALEHDPEAALDPNRVDPSLVSMLSGLKGRLQGYLDVSADRPGAKISLDGKPLGTAPLRAQVPIGRHKLTAHSADGKYSALDEVVVHPRRTARAKLELREAPQDSGGGGSSDAPAGTGPVLFGFGKPYGDLRLSWDVFYAFDWYNALGFSIEFGGGLSAQYVRVGLNLRVFPQFGLLPRAAFQVPVFERIRASIAVELPLIFTGYDPAPIAFGIGGAGGAEYDINKWLAIFGEAGARHFFLGTGDANRLTIQGGVRLRMP